MAHSVATGAIGGGYGPYSVRLSSIIDYHSANVMPTS